MICMEIPVEEGGKNTGLTPSKVLAAWQALGEGAPITDCTLQLGLPQLYELTAKGSPEAFEGLKLRVRSDLVNPATDIVTCGMRYGDRIVKIFCDQSPPL